MLALYAASPELKIFTYAISLLIAVILHEISHGYIANLLGDSTAKYAGRLSLNPIRHIDLWGTIIIPFLTYQFGGFIFGYAKPVPVNYYNLRYGKWGQVAVALAGPATNFVIVLICGLIVRMLPEGTALPYLFIMIGLVNAFLMLFNLIPIPPLDGSHVLTVFLERRPDITRVLERYGMFILIGIMLLAPGFLSRFVFGPAIYLTSWATGISPFELVAIF